MLSQRKRFNYMVNTTRNNSSSKKVFNTSAIKNNFGAPRQEPVIPSKFNEEKQNPKKIDQLQQINRKLIEETTKQFKKLESDVHRVQKILEQKQTALQSSKQEGEKMKKDLALANEEKKILIEAIFQKDLVIKEYENRIKQLIQNQVSFTTPEKPQKVSTQQVEMQTEPEPQTCAKTQLTKALSTNLSLEDQVYRLKQELFDATNKAKLIHQQFEAYKILKEIESIQSI